MKRFTVRARTDLKQFVAASLGISRGKAKELIDARVVFVNDVRVWIATHQLGPHDRVDIADSGSAGTEPRLAVVFEDDDMIAVNKPPGLVANQAPDSVESRLRRERKLPDVQAIHRLDKDTSGVLLLAKDQATFEQAKMFWQQHQVQKTYFAICHGSARFSKTNVAEPVEGRRAFSRVELVHSSGDYSLFRVQTATGRKHQIRLHLKSIRHPIVGDKEHGVKTNPDPLTRSVSRQMLHCSRLSLPRLDSLGFEEPGDESDEGIGGPEVAEVDRLEITAPLFPDFHWLATRLGLIKPDTGRNQQ
jgi:23S rRNA pseudouridine1911/1915/1917 synthase